MIPNKTMRGGVRYIKNDFRYSFLTVRLLKGHFLGEQRESGTGRAISRSPAVSTSYSKYRIVYLSIIKYYPLSMFLLVIIHW